MGWVGVGVAYLLKIIPYFFKKNNIIYLWTNFGPFSFSIQYSIFFRLFLELEICSISAILESYICVRNFYTLKK